MQKMVSLLLALSLLAAGLSAASAQETEPTALAVEIEDAPAGTLVSEHESAIESKPGRAEPTLEIFDATRAGGDTPLPTIEARDKSAPVAPEPITGREPIEPVSIEDAGIETKISISIVDVVSTSNGTMRDNGTNVQSPPSEGNSKDRAFTARLGTPAAPAPRPCQADHLCPRFGSAQRIGSGMIIHHRYCPIMGPCIHNTNPPNPNLTADDSSGEGPAPLFTTNPLWTGKKGSTPTGNTQSVSGANPTAGSTENFDNPNPKIIGLADGRTNPTLPETNQPTSPPLNPLAGLISGSNAPLLGLLALLVVGALLVARNGSKK